jgi:hypothetical protein
VRTEIVNSPSLGLRVFREEDGSVAWEGTFNGAQIKNALPVDKECIILLDPDVTKRAVFKNLFRVDREGNPKWFAELPASPDAFMDMRLEEGCLEARSWSGYKVRLDLHSGRRLAQEFTK